MLAVLLQSLKALNVVLPTRVSSETELFGLKVSG